MPFTRIALPETRLPQWQPVISQVLQYTLENTFAVPAGDCFQFFDGYKEGMRVFDAYYLCAKERPRSADFVFFHLTGGKPRSIEQKQAFYRTLTTELQAELNIHPNDVMIVLSFTQLEDWSFSGGEMAHFS